MSPTTIDDPFDPAPVDEVHLERTPLEVVLFQVRLPRSYTPLQDAIQNGTIARQLSDLYPYAETQDVVEFSFQPGQAPTQKPAGSKVLLMSDKSQSWTLNVARDSVALTTTKYLNRSDLLTRASAVLAVLAESAPPPHVARVGIRYINRLRDLEVVSDLVGGLAAEVQPMQQFSLSRGRGIHHSMNDVMYKWEDTTTTLQARWGILPPGQVVEGAVQPVDKPSWVLDIDAFDDGLIDFDPELVVDQLARLGERAYRFFRWMFSPSALAHFGIAE